MKKIKLEFYALNDDWNAKEIVAMNIFHETLTNDLIKYLDKKYTTFEDFKEKLKRELFYYYHSKREYEVAMGDLHGDYTEKISVYDQVIPNLDLLANYVFDEYNKNKRKKLEK